MKKTVVIVAVVVLLIAFLKKNKGNLIKAKALLYKGIKEIGQNASFNDSEFKELMTNAGWYSGASWCMFFSKMVYENTYPNLIEDFRKSLGGSTQQSWKNVKKGKSDSLYTVESGTPKIGDIVIWQNKSNPSMGHAGIVTVVNGDTYKSIEGNTSGGINTIEHELNYKGTDNYHKDKILLGFIRLK